MTSSSSNPTPELESPSGGFHEHRLHSRHPLLQRTTVNNQGVLSRSHQPGTAPVGSDGNPPVYVAADFDTENANAVSYDHGKGEFEVYDNDGSKIDMHRLFNKISARLLPLFFVMVIMCYVDRTSLAFAAIQLNADLRFAPSVYGMGSGLFFLGYSLFQIPSNLLLRRFGGPTWLAIIIAAWGLVASAFAGMSTATHFYLLRLLLGATEAGAFPGMWYVLTTFFPGDQITFPFAVVEAGISLSHVVAAPLAAACLSLDGLGGLAGWRWLFLLEGLPTLVLAAVMYRLLPRSPESADFLTPGERRALLARIENHDRSGHDPLLEDDDSSSRGGTKGFSGVAGNLGGASAAAGGGGVVKRAKARAHGPGSGGAAGAHTGQGAVGGGGGSSAAPGGVASSWHAFRLAVTNRWVWYLGGLKFVRDIASFGLIFWAPTIVNSLLQEMRAAGEEAAGDSGRRLLGAVMAVPADNHGTGSAAVLLTALPFALAAACGMLLAHSSQRTGERFLHIAVPYIVTGVILTLYSGAADRSPWLGFAALSLGVVGVYCGSGPCLSLLSELAAGPGLVVALPLYNSLGTLGGFLGPSLVGWLVQKAYSAGGADGGAKPGGSAISVIHGGGFGVSAVVLGSALTLAGFMMLGLGAMLGRLCVGLGRDAAAAASLSQFGGSGAGSPSEASERGDGAGRVPYSKLADVEGRETQVSGLPR